MRVSSGLPINWNDATDLSVKPLHYGWRTALPAGERVLAPGFVRDSRFHFTSVNNTITHTNPPDGENWLNELDYLSGGVGTKLIFDLNSDGQLTDSDRIQSGGSPVAGPTGIPIAIYQGAGLLSPPVLALLNAELSTTIFNDNPYHAPNEQPADPPAPIIDPVCRAVTSTLISTTGKSPRNTRTEYDDKYNVTGASFISPSLPDQAVSTEITDPNTKFKILIANQAYSPAVLWSYGGLPYQKIVDMAEYTTTGLTVASLPAFSRNTVGTLRFNMPKDAFSVKNWAGTTPADNRVGLHPTETGCTKGGGGSGGLSGGTQTGAIYTGDGHSLHRNGSLTFQLIKENTPDSAIEMGSAAGDPAFGYRVKVSDRKNYLLAEWTVFWHNKVTSCYGMASWHKNPGPDTSAPGDVVAPTPGALDPPWGDLGSVESVVVTEAHNPDYDADEEKAIIRIHDDDVLTGTKVVMEEYFNKKGKVEKTVITIIPPPRRVAVGGR